MNEIEAAKIYIKAVTSNIEGYSNAKRIKILTDDVEFWYMSAISWRNAYDTILKEVKK